MIFAPRREGAAGRDGGVAAKLQEMALDLAVIVIAGEARGRERPRECSGERGGVRRRGEGDW